MLILTRNKDQEFKIGDDITIKILSVNGKQVKIGIDAPKDINIVRTELLDKGKENV